MKSIYLEPSAIPASLRGGYSGRKFKAVVTSEPVTLSDTYWDGGTRSTYALINLSTGARLPASGKALSPPQFGGAVEPIRVNIPSGFALVKHSIFCGKDTGLTIYVRPENAAHLLPGPVELTACERAVLEYTRSRKSSYNGQNRFEMYVSDQRWKHDGVAVFSAEEWRAAQLALVERKLLSKSFAITPAGRNAVADSRQFCS